jgi:hypothetical protein
MRVEKHRNLVQSLILSLTRQVTETMDELPHWFRVCYLIQLLQFASHDFCKDLDFSEYFRVLLTSLDKQIVKLGELAKKPISFNEQGTIDRDHEQLQSVSQSVYDIHVSFSLCYFLLTDFQAQQDIDQI